MEKKTENQLSKSSIKPDVFEVSGSFFGIDDRDVELPSVGGSSSEEVFLIVQSEAIEGVVLSLAVEDPEVAQEITLVLILDVAGFLGEREVAGVVAHH